MLLNSLDPDSDSAKEAKSEIEHRHDVPVIGVNCAMLTADDVNNIIEAVLFRFPLKEISIDVPDWVEVLESDLWL